MSYDWQKVEQDIEELKKASLNYMHEIPMFQGEVWDCKDIFLRKYMFRWLRWQYLKKTLMSLRLK